METGSKAPDFSLNDAAGNAVRLSDFRGKWVVVYFYPKDNTPGCTTEAIDFSAALPEFENLNAVVVGISPDSEKKHLNFIEKHELKVRLLSDPEHEVIEAYGAWQLKKNYGREYWGVVRSTVLVDPEGNVAKHWKKVSVKGHVENVLKTLKDMN